jgi:predicted GNAT family N-acyltransferase
MKKQKIHYSECESTIFSFAQTDLMNKALKLRIKVFVKAQNVPIDMEIDGEDPLANHILVFYQGKPIATCRIRATDEGTKLERFAVKPAYRNNGIGKALVKESISYALKYQNDIYLYAQIQLIPFYESLGFVKLGKEFLEADIIHYKMIYQA